MKELIKYLDKQIEVSQNEYLSSNGDYYRGYRNALSAIRNKIEHLTKEENTQENIDFDNRIKGW